MCLSTAQCKVVLTCNEAVRGGRVVPLKSTVDAAVRSCPTVQHVFVSQRTENPTEMGPLDVPLEEVRHLRHTLSLADPVLLMELIDQVSHTHCSHPFSLLDVTTSTVTWCVFQAMSSQSPVCPAEPLDSEDLLFLLYTSGSTGKPKGVVHTQAGYLLYTSLTHQVHTGNTLYFYSEICELDWDRAEPGSRLTGLCGRK